MGSPDDTRQPRRAVDDGGGLPRRRPTMTDVAAEAGVSVATVSRVLRQPSLVSESTRERVESTLRRIGYVEPAAGERRARVTITDVAREAGVSIATVSRVLNRPEFVRPETRERVESAVAQLQFRPNRVASGLRTGVMNTIALLVGDIAQAWYAELAKAVEGELDDFGYSIVVYDLAHDPGRLVRYLESCEQQGIDAVIVATGDRISANIARALAALHERVPIVFAGQRPGTLDVPSVIYDDRTGASAATRHLLDYGGAPVAFLGRLPRSYLGAERFRGFANAVRKQGQDPETWAWPVSGFDYGPGYLAAREALAAGSVPRGIVAANDQLAIGAMRALHEHGLSIPEDVAIIGFGDLDVCRYIRPTLSSVRGPVRSIAQLTCKSLLAALDGTHLERTHKVHRTLAIRESSGGPLDLADPPDGSN